MNNKWLFANPEFLYLLITIPVIIFFYWKSQRSGYPTIKLGTLSGVPKHYRSWRVRLRHLPFVLRTVALCLIIVALARPQETFKQDKIKTEGIDIVLSLDISGSMMAQDFNPNRLEAAKKTASQFVDNRPNDRIGIVLFSGESFTQVPLTADRKILQQMISQITPVGVLDVGTAIGMGIATSVARLEESKAKSKIMILLTDGVNNAGALDPLTAVETAKQFGVKIYTIGVGSYGEAKVPVQTAFGIQYLPQKVEIDEKLLTLIAQETGGQYYRATDNKKLAEIYKEIDKLEKTTIELDATKNFVDKFYPLVLLALACICLELLLKHSYLRSLI